MKKETAVMVGELLELMSDRYKPDSLTRDEVIDMCITLVYNKLVKETGR